MERLNETISYRIAESIQLFYMPILVILGTLGNCLSIIVFFSTKLRKLSSSYYLSALALSDTGFLLFTFLPWLNMSFGIDWFNTAGVCEIAVYMTQVCSFLSVWFVVAFTVERFIAVRYPLKRPSLCTVSKAKIVLLGLSLFALLCYTPYIFVSEVSLLSQYNGTYEVCDTRQELMGLAMALNHIDVIITLVIPFIAIVVLNTLISRTVFKVARVRRSMTKASETLSRTKSVSSQTKVTEMLLVVSTVFICLNLPSYLIRIWVYLYEHIEQPREPNADFIAIQVYFNLLFQTNFGINFALYCVSGQNFRKALMSLFRKSHRRNETTQVTVVSEYCRTASTRRTMTINDSWRDAHEMIPIKGNYGSKSEL